MKKRIGITGKAMVAAVVLVLATSLAVMAAGSEGWKPQKAIHLIVPSAGYYETQSRVLGDEMAKMLGQPVVIEIVAGGGHRLATIQAYKAKPDGHTILMANSTTMILNQFVYGADYDFSKFEYLAQIYDLTKGISTLAVSGTKTGLNSWNDVLKLKRGVRFATTGKGTLWHISGIAISQAFGLKDPVYVFGYSQPAELYGAVARGECDLACAPSAPMKPYFKSGDLQPLLAFSKKEKLEGYPNVPTLGELGHPEGVDQTGAQHVYMAPPGTPPQIMKVLSDVVYKAASGNVMKQFQEKALDGGAYWAPLAGNEARRQMDHVYATVKPLIPHLQEKK